MDSTASVEAEVATMEPSTGHRVAGERQLGDRPSPDCNTPAGFMDKNCTLHIELWRPEGDTLEAQAKRRRAGAMVTLRSWHSRGERNAS